MRATIKFNGDISEVSFGQGATIADLLRTSDIRPAEVSVIRGDTRVNASDVAQDGAYYEVNQLQGKVG